MTNGLTRKLLTEGDSPLSYIQLYTDADNKTTNHIYPLIGYKPLEDFSLYIVEESK